jgi:hypothetical protein
MQGPLTSHSKHTGPEWALAMHGDENRFIDIHSLHASDTSPKGPATSRCWERHWAISVRDDQSVRSPWRVPAVVA